MAKYSPSGDHLAAWTDAAVLKEKEKETKTISAIKVSHVMPNTLSSRAVHHVGHNAINGC